MKLKMLLTLTVIFYLIYPKMVSEVFGVLQCTGDIDGKQYMVVNTKYECFGPEHVQIITFFAIPIIGIWILGVPILIVYCIYKNRKMLDSEENLRMWGFWYLGLKRECFYWESLLEFKKLIILLINVDLFQMGQVRQGFVILSVLFFFFYICGRLQPYKVSYLNTAAYFAEMAQFLSFALIMVYLRDGDSEAADNAIFFFLLGVNLFFIVAFFFYYGRYYFRKIYGQYQSVKNNKK